MKQAMYFSHSSTTFGHIAESMLHCNISVVSWEETRLSGTKAMTARYRPIHCGFETLRHASESARNSQTYRRIGSAANEQLIARGTGISARVARPTAIFSDFREC
jgi:hypothetical protein